MAQGAAARGGQRSRRSAAHVPRRGAARRVGAAHAAEQGGSGARALHLVRPAVLRARGDAAAAARRNHYQFPGAQTLQGDVMLFSHRPNVPAGARCVNNSDPTGRYTRLVIAPAGAGGGRQLHG